MRKQVHIMWDDSVCTVVPSCPELEKFLTYTEKSLEPDPNKNWVRKTVFRTKPLFKTIAKERNYNVIQTMQGLWLRIKTFLEENGYEVVMHDRRMEFPAPKLEAMSGFRFSQEALLTNFLKKDSSGLLGAPTRYGKTILIINTIKAFPGVTTVVTAPGADLVKQLYEDIKASISRSVVCIGAGSRTRYPSEDITVCSMDSLHKCDTKKTRLLLIDEPHAAVTNTRLPRLAEFDISRKYGFGATLKGRYDNKDILIEALIGPVLQERTFQEAVAEGAVAQIVAILVRIPLQKTHPGDRSKAYKDLFYQSSPMGQICKRICRDLIPEDWQTILFIKNQKEAEFYKDFIGEEGTIAMAKLLKAKERDELMQLMRDDKVKRCLASDIYAQGVTFNYVRAMINLAGGGYNTSTIQKPGRLAEIREGKKCGVIFDFEFYADGIPADKLGGAQALVRESKARRKAYEEKGYEILTVDSFEELKETFNERCL